MFPRRNVALVCLALISAAALRAWRVSLAQTRDPKPQTPATSQRDFEFAIGSWKTHIERLEHPLSGSTTWVTSEGTVITQPVWDGRANLEELDATGAAGSLEGLTLRLNNRQTGQWDLYWANSSDGQLGQPMIGEFRDGRGEFYDQESFNGKTIYARNVYFDISANSYRFEQAFSVDGGKTWEPNFRATVTRVEDAAASTPALSSNSRVGGQHDFDFEMGTWKMHVRRLQHPLTGSTNWIDFDANSFTRPVWRGRAQLEQFEGDAPTGHIEGLTLRLFNPGTREWRLYWANANDVSIGTPQVGRFVNGRGEFYGQDVLQGRSIFVRYVWYDITPHSAQFEQAYSADGGKTWEPNWLTADTTVTATAATKR